MQSDGYDYRTIFEEKGTKFVEFSIEYLEKRSIIAIMLYTILSTISYEKVQLK